MTTPSSEMSVGLVEPQVARFDSPFTFANGEVLERHELVYETYGELNSAGDNAVLICHALSGSHHAAGFHSVQLFLQDRLGYKEQCYSLYESAVSQRIWVV